MLSRNDAIKYSKAFLKACDKLPITIEKAVLFGSVVSAMNKKDSDIDIALFSKSFSDNILTNLDMVGKVAIQFPEIDIHTFPSKDYRSDTAMLSEIRKSGIELI